MKGGKRARTQRGTACQRCVAGKRKCDGEHPCGRCARMGKPCVVGGSTKQVKKLLVTAATAPGEPEAGPRSVALPPVRTNDAMMRLILAQPPRSVLGEAMALPSAFQLDVSPLFITVEVPSVRQTGLRYFEEALRMGRIFGWNSPHDEPNTALFCNGSDPAQFYGGKRVSDIATKENTGPDPHASFGLTRALSRAKAFSIQQVEFQKDLYTSTGGHVSTRVRMFAFMDENAEAKWLVLSVCGVGKPQEPPLLAIGTGDVASLEPSAAGSLTASNNADSMSFGDSTSSPMDLWRVDDDDADAWLMGPEDSWGL